MGNSVDINRKQAKVKVNAACILVTHAANIAVAQNSVNPNEVRKYSRTYRVQYRCRPVCLHTELSATAITPLPFITYARCCFYANFTYIRSFRLRVGVLMTGKSVSPLTTIAMLGNFAAEMTLQRNLIRGV